MCTCIRSQLARHSTSIFSIILHWNQVAFQYHLALDNSRREACPSGRYNRAVDTTSEKPRPVFVMNIEYWQRLGAEAIFEAAWQMAVDAHRRGAGGSDELRLRRTVEHFQRERR